MNTKLEYNTFSKEEIRYLRSMPFEQKILRTNTILTRYFANNLHTGIAYSGGKDSSVLLEMCARFLRIYPRAEKMYAYCTLCEGDEQAIIIERAKERYGDVIEIVAEKPPPFTGEDRPLLNKYTDRSIHERKWYIRCKEGGVERANQHIPSYMYQFKDTDVHKVVSSRCCDVIKKQPQNAFFKNKGVVTIITGMRADESLLRYIAYAKNGCYTVGKTKAMPIGFWTKKDVQQALILYQLRDNFVANNFGRSGCPWCPYGKPRTEESIIDEVKRRLISYANKHGTTLRLPTEPVKTNTKQYAQAVIF